MTPWIARGRTIAAGRPPSVMGIVNVTPDSFSDGGRSLAVDDAVALGRRLAAEGAGMLDVGGESSRPGADPVSLEEELRRVVPVIEALARSMPLPISVDTTKAEVARRAIGAGASVVNDITALGGDPEMARLLGGSDAGVVLMHMAGDPRTMQDNPLYADVVEEVHAYLEGRIAWCERIGIGRERIAIDPGIGFGKTHAHNLELLRNLARFANLGCAILIGTSRKGFLGAVTGRPIAGRMAASVASALAGVARGAGIVRVHDVGPTVDAIKIWGAVEGWDEA